MRKPLAIIVDIDGTVALRGDRSPYDMTQVSHDKPHQVVIDLILAYCAAAPVITVFVSGRFEAARQDTLAWLNRHGLFGFKRQSNPRLLYMRADGDLRPDDVVKEQIYHIMIEPFYDVQCVFDDRNRVVAMWRRHGLTCLQVADGDF